MAEYDERTRCNGIYYSVAYYSKFKINFNYKHISMYTIIVLLLITNFICVKCERNVYYTNQFAVHLRPETDANVIAERYGFINLREIGNLKDHYLFEHNHINKRSTEYSHTHHSKLCHDSDVLWTEQQKVKTRVKRDNRHSSARYTKQMPDPLFSEMWYLNKGARGNYDMNVAEAWAMGYSGKGIVVTILDDGIQPNHPDLANNYDPQASYDINDNDPDPTPQDNGDNKHGTRCAGEVAAEAYNEFCGVGIAFNASIGGVRMLDGTVTDEVEARALSMNPQHIHIYSASWGPEDDGKTVDGPGRLAQRAFIDGIRKGRGGLGSVFIWASGNGGRRFDNCNCDGYTNSIYTLSISSATQNGAKPWYLEECSSTLASTYSSGTPGRDENVITVDQDATYFHSLEKGEVPNASKLCTRSHTGTSASAPIAAAIAALALEANPTLTWRDMQYLVILSSRYEPLRHESGWITNGVGRKVSHKFGYGLIDAHAMVKYAEVWTELPLQRICETPVDNTEREIPTQLKQPLEVSMNTDACHGTLNNINYLEHVQARITLKYRPRGYLKITLISPSGTASHLLLPRPRDIEDSAFNNWPFLSVHFWGEQSAGEWRLLIQNEGSRTARWAGKLISWSLVFFGTTDRPSHFIGNSNESTHYLPRRTYQSNLHLSECAKNGHGFQALGSHECVRTCPNGEWPDYRTGTCQKCASDCATCFGPTSDACLSCKNPNFFYGYHCVSNCPDTHYGDRNLKECLPCSINCRACENSPYNCISCRPHLTLTKSNRCVDPCLMNSVTSNCVKCHESCEKCYGKESYECSSCRGDDKLFIGQCIKGSCPNDSYVHPNIDSGGLECLSCHYTCQTCNGSSHTNCTSCNKNATLTNDGICYSCLDGEFMNQETHTCASCHSRCSTCTGPTATDCTNCEPPYSLDGNRCVPCCSDVDNEITSILTDRTDCCHCQTPDGPCFYNRDKPRSVPMTLADGRFLVTDSFNREKLFNIFIGNPLFFIAIVCGTGIVLFGVVFTSLQFKSASKKSYFHKYRKDSSGSSVKYSNLEKISLTVDDDEEDSLFEKT